MSIKINSNPSSLDTFHHWYIRANVSWIHTHGAPNLIATFRLLSLRAIPYTFISPLNTLRLD